VSDFPITESSDPIDIEEIFVEHVHEACRRAYDALMMVPAERFPEGVRQAHCCTINRALRSVTGEEAVKAAREVAGAIETLTNEQSSGDLFIIRDRLQYLYGEPMAIQPPGTNIGPLIVDASVGDPSDIGTDDPEEDPEHEMRRRHWLDGEYDTLDVTCPNCNLTTVVSVLDASDRVQEFGDVGWLYRCSCGAWLRIYRHLISHEGPVVEMHDEDQEGYRPDHGDRYTSKIANAADGETITLPEGSHIMPDDYTHAGHDNKWPIISRDEAPRDEHKRIVWRVEYLDGTSVFIVSDRYIRVDSCFAFHNWASKQEPGEFAGRGGWYNVANVPMLHVKVVHLAHYKEDEQERAIPEVDVPITSTPVEGSMSKFHTITVPARAIADPHCEFCGGNGHIVDGDSSAACKCVWEKITGLAAQRNAKRHDAIIPSVRCEKCRGSGKMVESYSHLGPVNVKCSCLVIPGADQYCKRCQGTGTYFVGQSPDGPHYLMCACLQRPHGSSPVPENPGSGDRKGQSVRGPQRVGGPTGFTGGGEILSPEPTGPAIPPEAEAEIQSKINPDCPTCGGSGRVKTGSGFFQQNRWCPECFPEDNKD